MRDMSKCQLNSGFMVCNTIQYNIALLQKLNICFLCTCVLHTQEQSYDNVSCIILLPLCWWQATAECDYCAQCYYCLEGTDNYQLCIWNYCEFPRGSRNVLFLESIHVRQLMLLFFSFVVHMLYPQFIINRYASIYPQNGKP